MRVAWTGPLPTSGAGVPYAATQFIRGLAAQGVSVDCFVAGDPVDLSPSLLGLDHVGIVGRHPKWIWDTPVGQHDMSGYIADKASVKAAEGRLFDEMRHRHATRPYDAWLHFSRPEPGVGRRARGGLPPLVLQPQVHALGELRGLWNDREVAWRAESPQRLFTAAAVLSVRSGVQRLQVSRAQRVVVASSVFGQALIRDCGVAPEQIVRVPNPIDLDRFRAHGPRRPATERVELVVVCYLAVRKGIEMVVRLSHRLADLDGSVRISVVGAGRPWSDYGRLLDFADQRVLRPIGLLDAAGMREVYARSHALLAPSHYEPFGLSVGEALACGLPVVASDAVGSVEDFRSDAVRHFRAGDGDAFEHEVRRVVTDIAAGVHFASEARRLAIEHFDERRVGAALARALCLP